MQCCGINACETHQNSGFSHCDLEQPCNIKLKGGVLVIHPTNVTFLTGIDSLYLYEVTYPFTREDLMCLNDIDSDEPDAYVRVLKQQKRNQHSIRGTLKERCQEQELREELTKLKELVRRQTMLLQVKDREITWLKAKLNL
jgi:hypothetical protein